MIEIAGTNVNAWAVATVYLYVVGYCAIAFLMHDEDDSSFNWFAVFWPIAVMIMAGMFAVDAIQRRRWTGVSAIRARSEIGGSLMIHPDVLRARARELRIAAATIEFVDIHLERLEMAGLLEQCADKIERLRKPRRFISVGKENADD